MLNELIELHFSMKAAGIVADAWCRGYEECRTIGGLFLMIAADGFLRCLEPIPQPESKRLRTYAAKRNFSFPGFNIKPLLLAKSETAKDAVKSLKKLCQSTTHHEVDIDNLLHEVHLLWEVCESLWTERELDRITKCLESAGLRERLGQALDRIPQDCSAILELMKRSAKVDVFELQESVKHYILSRVERHPEKANLWIDLLVSIKSQPSTVPIVLELADHSFFQYPANHTRVIAWINRTLMELSETEAGENCSAVGDAFGWPLAEKDLKSKFHQVKLPRLGNVILRAMNKESPCQKRYGRIDAQSFPAGREAKQAMANALTWLGAETRRAKTWQDISRTCGYDRALLFAYPSTLHEDPPELAGWLQPTDADGAKFEAAAARVIPALQGICNVAPNAQVRIFALAKLDQARTKVLVSKNYSVGAFLSAAAAWQLGCRNVPAIRLNIGSKEKSWWIEPVTPFPIEVVKCLNVAWFEGGKRTDSVHALAIDEGLEILLETKASAQQIVSRALSLVVNNAGSLLLALGHADHRGDGAITFASRYNRDSGLLLCILGLLLHKQNLMKGDYMHNAPFLVGRLLALADLLHKEYCKHVRQGDTPPQLIGNALMSAASDNPLRGIVRLRERLTVYQAWANTAKGDGLGLAKWALGQMGSVATELAGLDLPDRADDAAKAQVLLGYLARLEGKGPGKDDDLPVFSNKEVNNGR